MGELLCGSPFAFYIQVNIANKSAPKLKSVGVQPLGFGKGWSPSQGRNSVSSKEKFADIKRNKANSYNTERTKPQIKKPHAEKKQQTRYPTQQTKQSKTLNPACGT